MKLDKFEFSTTSRIIFGSGSIQNIPKIIADFGNKAFIIRSKKPISFLQIQPYLEDSKIKYINHIVGNEPNYEDINKAKNLAIENHCDFVIGIGGGSVLDTAKAVAAMITNKGELIDYLEVVGKGQKIQNRCAPLLAIPTTSGTGSEVTKNAVIEVPDKKVKVSMRSHLMLPWIALVDPILTYSLPPKLTAYTGMDAFVQVVEPFVSKRANVITDLLSREGIRKASQSLLIAFKEGENEKARSDMSEVSLLSGLSLANAGVGAVHGFAGVIGGMFHAPHGAVCASLLTSVIHMNISALEMRDPSSRALDRYKEISKIITNNELATVQDGIKWFKNLCNELKIPSLTDFGVRKSEFPLILERSKMTNSMKTNPIILQDEELLEILNMAF